ncbi:MAG TPA: glycosyltransferase 87 family protein [Burkholderiales bacterium]
MWSWYLASRALCLLLLVPESGVLSDITYFGRVLAPASPSGALPEYPWPAVALLELPRQLGATEGAPYHLALIGLFVAIDAAFAACLWRAGGRRMTRAMVLWLAVGPLLGPLVLTRFDTLAAALSALALLSLGAARPGAAGVAAAFGCGIKLFPAVGLPALLIPGGLRARVAAVLGAAITGTALAAVSAAAGGVERLWSPFAFQAGRGLHVEAFAALPFLWARHFAAGGWESRLGECRCYELHGPGVDLAMQLAAAALALGAIGLAALYWRALRAHPAARNAALAARLTVIGLILFIATNKVFSPQYLIWLAAPLAVLALLAEDGLPRADFTLLLAACALTHVVFPLNYGTLAHVEQSRAWILTVLLARDAALIALGARLAVRAWRDTVRPAGVPGSG